MKKTDFYRLADMIEEIKSLDEMIKLHSKNADKSSIMLAQYQGKKIRLVNALIDALASENLSSSKHLQLIKSIIEKFFPEAASSNSTEINSDRTSGYQLLEHALAS